MFFSVFLMTWISVDKMTLQFWRFWYSCSCRLAERWGFVGPWKNDWVVVGHDWLAVVADVRGVVVVAVAVIRGVIEAVLVVVVVVVLCVRVVRFFSDNWSTGFGRDVGLGREICRFVIRHGQHICDALLFFEGWFGG